MSLKFEENSGLYHPSFEKDSCGIGFIAHLKGTKSHSIINDAITMLENMEHRGAYNIYYLFNTYI